MLGKRDKNENASGGVATLTNSLRGEEKICWKNLISFFSYEN